MELHPLTGPSVGILNLNRGLKGLILEPWHPEWRKDNCKVVMERVFYVLGPLSCVNREETIEKREERFRTEMGKCFPYLPSLYF